MEIFLLEIQITAFVDSDHAHDLITRRSITGILKLVVRTPVFILSKRQGAIETSTYGDEFCAMQTAVEKVQSVHYMMRRLGIKVSKGSLICGDNIGIFQNCTLSVSLFKKKHVAIANLLQEENMELLVCHLFYAGAPYIWGSTRFRDVFMTYLNGQS